MLDPRPELFERRQACGNRRLEAAARNAAPEHAEPRQEHTHAECGDERDHDDHDREAVGCGHSNPGADMELRAFGRGSDTDLS